MVKNDLKRLEDTRKKHLRLFGPRSLDNVPPPLHQCVMPYGESLNGPDSPIPGTQGDFAQRAMRHFAVSVLENTACVNDPNEDADAVRKQSKTWRSPIQVSRSQKSDAEIIDIVPQLWDRSRGSSAKMLRVLRDEERISCEQGRFAKLFKEAKVRHGLQ